MNFTAHAFQRNRGARPSVSVTTVDGQTITSGHHNDRIDIRAGAINRGGYAEATGLNNSTVATAAGDDSVRIHAHARGMSTNAWAMRNSSLDVGPGDDNVDLRAVTRAGAFDPAYGMDNSSFTSGQGRDKLRINSIARGNTTDTIASFGALNSQINTGADHDNVHIRASATNRSGYAEAIGLDNSVLETETGDDVVRIHAHARGMSTNAWAMRNSSLDVGPGDDSVVIRGNALNSTVSTGEGFDSVKVTGLETQQLLVDTGAQDDELTVDGGTGITYISGTGSDKLRLTRNYFTSLLQAKESQEHVNPTEGPMVQNLNTPVAETGSKAETNLFKPALAEPSTGSVQTPELDSLRSSEATEAEVSEAEASDPQMSQSEPLMFMGFLTGENSDSKAETNLSKPELTETSTGSVQTPELNNLRSSEAEASDPQMNQSAPLMFVDFLTGENGDSIDFDDILIGHGIGLNRQSVFEDGFLSFAQEGNDSLLYFDSDGFNQKDNDKVALVIFKNVQTADFSEHNLNSRIINKNDFLLSQKNQSSLSLNPNSATEAPAKDEEFDHAAINPAIAELRIEPMPMSPGLQPSNDQLNLFTSNPAIPGSETNPILTDSDLQPSIQLV